MMYHIKIGKIKLLFYCIAFLISVQVIAQEKALTDRLSEYNISADLLAKSIGGADIGNDYFYSVTYISHFDSETIIEKATFDPTQKKGEQWVLISYNGNDPTKKEFKEFKKDHNFKEEEINAKIDNSSWITKLDNSDYLVVTFKYDQSSLKPRYKYMADIVGKAYLNKKTKKLEKIEYINVKPTKIKPFNVDKYFMTINYVFNETEKIYQVEKEEISMDVKMLGKSVSTKLIAEYSNYKKI